MKKSLHLLCFVFTLGAVGAFAGTGPAYAPEPATEASARFPFEFAAQYSYIADSTVARGARDVRDFEETYSFLSFVYTPRVKIGILRLGAAWERFGFGLPANVELADTLQSVSAVIGLDTQFSDSILIRIEAQPGLYGSGNELNGDTFNVPFVLGGTYIYNSDLQFVLGVSVNFDRQYPVFPGGGVRWRLAPQWVLNAVVPTPRLEFEASQNLTFFAGADLKGSTFRVGQNFGTRQAGNPRLDHAVIDYYEMRAGGGVEIKISPATKLTLEGGFLPYREFDYHRANVRYHHESGAPYASVAFRAAF